MYQATFGRNSLVIKVNNSLNTHSLKKYTGIFLFSGLELFELLRQKLSFAEVPEKKKIPQLLPEVTFEGVVKHIKSEKCKNIITMAGAGISTCKVIDHKS